MLVSSAAIELSALLSGSAGSLKCLMVVSSA